MANYIDSTDAEEYLLANKLKRKAWTKASAGDREIALTSATKIINRLPLLGDKTDAEQENAFPRGGDTEVPQDIKDACVEIAYGLLDGIDPVKEFEDLRVQSKSYGSVSITSNGVAKVYAALGIVSFEAYLLLLPYLRPLDTLSIERSR